MVNWLYDRFLKNNFMCFFCSHTDSDAFLWFRKGFYDYVDSEYSINVDPKIGVDEIINYFIVRKQKNILTSFLWSETKNQLFSYIIDPPIDTIGYDYNFFDENDNKKTKKTLNKLTCSFQKKEEQNNPIISSSIPLESFNKPVKITIKELDDYILEKEIMDSVSTDSEEDEMKIIEKQLLNKNPYEYLLNPIKLDNLVNIVKKKKIKNKEKKFFSKNDNDEINPIIPTLEKKFTQTQANQTMSPEKTTKPQIDPQDLDISNPDEFLKELFKIGETPKKRSFINREEQIHPSKFDNDLIREINSVKKITPKSLFDEFMEKNNDLFERDRENERIRKIEEEKEKKLLMEDFLINDYVKEDAIILQLNIVHNLLFNNNNVNNLLSSSNHNYLMELVKERNSDFHDLIIKMEHDRKSPPVTAGTNNNPNFTVGQIFEKITLNDNLTYDNNLCFFTTPYTEENIETHFLGLFLKDHYNENIDFNFSKRYIESTNFFQIKPKTFCDNLRKNIFYDQFIKYFINKLKRTPKLSKTIVIENILNKIINKYKIKINTINPQLYNSCFQTTSLDPIIKDKPLINYYLIKQKNKIITYDYRSFNMIIYFFYFRNIKVLGDILSNCPSITKNISDYLPLLPLCKKTLYWLKHNNIWPCKLILPDVLKDFLFNFCGINHIDCDIFIIRQSTSIHLIKTNKTKTIKNRNTITCPNILNFIKLYIYLKDYKFISYNSEDKMNPKKWLI